jgi:hypothetical protein
MKVVKKIFLGLLIFAAGIYGGRLLFKSNSSVPAPTPTYFQTMQQVTQPEQAPAL